MENSRIIQIKNEIASLNQELSICGILDAAREECDDCIKCLTRYLINHYKRILDKEKELRDVYQNRIKELIELQKDYDEMMRNSIEKLSDTQSLVNNNSNFNRI